MFRLQTFLGLTLALLLSTACSGGLANPFAEADTQLARVLLWHTWGPHQAEALDTMLAAYENLNPNVKVISVAVPEETLAARLNNQSHAGLGPDLILTDAWQIYDIAAGGLIRDLAPLDLDVTTYLSNALTMLSDGTRLYGLPMSAHTQVLYYNRTLVAEPPSTITELVERIEGGEFFAQSPDFLESYWGVGAYGGGLADNQGRLLFGLGGFSNWLDFLEAARTLPGFLLDDNLATLQQAFINGEVAYYVGDSEQFIGLVAAMGPGVVGVAPLPTGPNGDAPRPFLQLDAFALTNVSNEREFRQALDLAQFLTGMQNQLALATADLGLAPVNNQVRLTPNMPTNSLTVARQSRTAETISFVNQPLWRDLMSGGLGFFNAYQQVTQGVLPADEMIAQGLQNFEEAYGLQPKTMEVADLCPLQPASINLWHGLRFEEAQVLGELARAFESTCPGTKLTLIYVPIEDMRDRFRQIHATNAAAPEAPDLLILSSRWLVSLAEEGLLLDLTERVSADFLQQFLPEAVETMRYGGRLFGVPESLEVLALFHNPTLAADPPIDVEQLVQSVRTDRRLALPVGFFWGYWGMDPFGGFTFDSYSGRINKTAGLTSWLGALQQIDAVAGVDFYFDDRAAEDAFAFEEAAYLVSGPWSLARLQEELGNERFRVTPLPNGPLMAGSPMLQVVGTAISIDADDLDIGAALAFSYYLNLPASQQRLAATGNHVSASVTVGLSAYPNIEGFREQAKSVSLVVENSNFARLEAEGDQLYRSVLRDGVDPAEAVPAFVEAVHRKNGVE